MQRNSSSAKSEKSDSWIYYSKTWLQFQFFMLQCFFYRFSNHPPSLEDLLYYIASFGWSWPSICWLCRYSSVCPIRRPLKSSASCGNQNSTVQGSSSHKCGQGVWWDALNVVAATIPPITLRLTPSLKLFLYSVAPSGNVPLTWPWPASLALPSECMDSSKLYWSPRPWVWHMTWLPY